MKTYADRLNYAMRIREIGQSELSRLIGVKPQSIQYLCSQGTNSVHTVKIARALHISPDWLDDGLGDIEIQTIELCRDIKRLSVKDTKTIELLVKTLLELKPVNGLPVESEVKKLP